MDAPGTLKRRPQPASAAIFRLFPLAARISAALTRLRLASHQILPERSRKSFFPPLRGRHCRRRHVRPLFLLAGHATPNALGFDRERVPRSPAGVKSST